MRILFTLLFLIPIVSFSQERIVKVDRFTSDSTITTSDDNIATMLSSQGKPLIGYGLSVSTIRVKSTIGLSLYIRSLGVNSIDSDKKVYFKFSDGDLVVLQTSGKYNIATSGKTLYTVVILKGEELEKFKAKELTDIRVETSEYPLDYVVKESRKDFIKKSLALL